MSETIETAFAEYQQELGVRPGTFIAFEVAGARIAHVADDTELASEDLLGPWQEEAFVRKLDPPTWRLADALRTRADGARVPSARKRSLSMPASASPYSSMVPCCVL